MIFFTIIGIICIIGWIATWIYAAYDMFKRRDMKTWHRVAWLAAIILFPILGLIVYIIARPPAGELLYKGETVQ